MKHIVRKMLLPAFALLAVVLAGGSLSAVLAQQGSEDRAIDQAQRAVRQRIITQEGGRNLTVLFNTDAQTDVRSRTAVRVRGTGSFSRTNDSRYTSSRDNDRRSRDFSYEAMVNNRSRYGSVSGVTYALRSGWTDYGRDTSRDDNRRDDNRRDDNRRDDNSRDNNDRDNNDRDDRDGNGGGFGAGNRPNGSVSYSGPIMNRHSNKGMDVTERSNRDGANIQQWSYADQPNQNWDVIDLGNGESAIISRQSGRALTAQGGRDNNGANIIQQGWRGTAQQRWRFEQVGSDYYRIVSVDNGKCLDVTGEGRQDGANIQLWDYANQANQQWRLRR
ncbi:MAG: RICIN domain-containing protein [Acidobacteriota bacterium]